MPQSLVLDALLTSISRPFHTGFHVSVVDKTGAPTQTIGHVQAILSEGVRRMDWDVCGWTNVLIESQPWVP
jgi:hypothetical protein